MKKILLTGCPSSGKTTLGYKLSEKLNIPLFHLDKIFWAEKGGIKQKLFAEKIQELIDENPVWIMDGNFPRSVTYEQRLKEADTVIIFELPKWIIVWRLLKRTIKYYGKQRPDMHANQVVTLKDTFRLLKYILPYSTEVEWEKINKHPHLTVFKIKTLKDEKNFLNKIPTSKL